jgi:hypothetical protein
VTEAPAPRAPLTVETDLELTVDGVRADVRSTGDRLFVEFPSLGAVARAARASPQGEAAGIASLLAVTDLTVEVRSRGRTVAAIGADAPAGPLSRWLGTAPAQVRPAGLVAAVGQEVAAGVRLVRELVG